MTHKTVRCKKIGRLSKYVCKTEACLLTQKKGLYVPLKGLIGLKM